MDNIVSTKMFTLLQLETGFLAGKVVVRATAQPELEITTNNTTRNLKLYVKRKIQRTVQSVDILLPADRDITYISEDIMVLDGICYVVETSFGLLKKLSMKRSV